MASSSSSSSTTVPSSPFSSFTFSTFTPNISHALPVKLDRITSYCGILNFVTVLRLHNVGGFIDGSSPCPSQFVLDHHGNPTNTVNLEFLKCQTLDQTLLSWFISSLTEPVLAHVVGLSTARDVRQFLEKAYLAQFRAKIMNLKYQLHTLKKGSLSLSDYVQKKKSIFDNLVAVAQPVSDFDLASSLLSGLSSEYEAFSTSITTHVEPISLDDLIGFLFSQEARNEETSALKLPQQICQLILLVQIEEEGGLLVIIEGVDVAAINMNKDLLVDFLVVVQLVRLTNLLRVPNIAKNLLSVQQFTEDNNVVFEFHPSCCYVKDQVSGQIILLPP